MVLASRQANISSTLAFRAELPVPAGMPLTPEAGLYARTRLGAICGQETTSFIPTMQSTVEGSQYKDNHVEHRSRAVWGELEA